MTDQEWFTQRFDRVDKDNAACLLKLDAVEQTVAKHSAYWEITKWAAVSLAGLFVSFMAYLGFSIKR